MSFMDLITGATINRGVDRWRATDGAVLIDVRSEEEYGQAIFPGASIFPLTTLSACFGNIRKRRPRFSSIASRGREAVKRSRF